MFHQVFLRAEKVSFLDLQASVQCIILSRIITLLYTLGACIMFQLADRSGHGIDLPSHQGLAIQLPLVIEIRLKLLNLLGLFLFLFAV